MNITICVLLLVILTLGVGQAIVLNKKLNLMVDKVERLEKGVDIIDDTCEVDLRFKDEIIRGKLEEINQRSKEGFQVNLNHLLQLRQSAFDLEVNSNENRDKINAAIKQESAKHMLIGGYRK